MYFAKFWAGNTGPWQRFGTLPDSQRGKKLLNMTFDSYDECVAKVQEYISPYPESIYPVGVFEDGLLVAIVEGEKHHFPYDKGVPLIAWWDKHTVDVVIV